MGEPLVCVPCEKDNHRYCLQRVVNVATGNVTDCECVKCEENQLREERTYGGGRHGRRSS